MPARCPSGPGAGWGWDRKVPERPRRSGRKANSVASPRCRNGFDILLSSSSYAIPEIPQYEHEVASVHEASRAVSPSEPRHGPAAPCCRGGGRSPGRRRPSRHGPARGRPRNTPWLSHADAARKCTGLEGPARRRRDLRSRSLIWRESLRADRTGWSIMGTFPMSGAPRRHPEWRLRTEGPSFASDVLGPVDSRGLQGCPRPRRRRSPEIAELSPGGRS